MAGGSSEAARRETPARAGGRPRRAAGGGEGPREGPSPAPRTPFSRLTKGLAHKALAKGRKGGRAAGFAARLLERTSGDSGEDQAEGGRILSQKGHLSVAPSEAVMYFEGQSFSAKVFDDTYVRGAKGVEGLSTIRFELDTLKEHAATEMQRKVLSNYKALAGLSGHIDELETEMSAVRQSVHALKGADGTKPRRESRSLPPAEVYFSGGGSRGGREGRGSRWQELLDALDISIGEKKTCEALQILRTCKAFLDQGTAFDAEEGRRALVPRQESLVETVIRGMRNAPAGSTLLSEAQQLLELDGELASLSALLQHHTVAISRGSKALGGDRWIPAEAVVLQAGAASVLVCQEVSKALRNAVTLLEGRGQAWSSHFLRWVKQQLEALASLLTNALLRRSIDEGDVLGVAGAVQIVDFNCKAILEGKGLVLAGCMSRALRPAVRQTVRNRGRRLRACLERGLEHGSADTRYRCGAWRTNQSAGGLPKLSSEHGQHFAAAVLETLDILVGVAWPDLVADVRGAIEEAASAFTWRERDDPGWVIVDEQAGPSQGAPPPQTPPHLASARQDAAAVLAWAGARLDAFGEL